MRDIEEIEVTASEVALDLAQRLTQEYQVWKKEVRERVVSCGNNRVLSIDAFAAFGEEKESLRWMYLTLFDQLLPKFLQSPFPPSHTAKLLVGLQQSLSWVSIFAETKIHLPCNGPDAEPVSAQDMRDQIEQMFGGKFREVSSSWSKAPSGSSSERLAAQEGKNLAEKLQDFHAQAQLDMTSLQQVLKNHIDQSELVFQKTRQSIDHHLKSLRPSEEEVHISSPILSSAHLRNRTDIEPLSTPSSLAP